MAWQPREGDTVQKQYLSKRSSKLQLSWLPMACQGTFNRFSNCCMFALGHNNVQSPVQQVSIEGNSLEEFSWVKGGMVAEAIQPVPTAETITSLGYYGISRHMNHRERAIEGVFQKAKFSDQTMKSRGA